MRNFCFGRWDHVGPCTRQVDADDEPVRPRQRPRSLLRLRLRRSRVSLALLRSLGLRGGREGEGRAASGARWRDERTRGTGASGERGGARGAAAAPSRPAAGVRSGRRVSGAGGSALGGVACLSRHRRRRRPNPARAHARMSEPHLRQPVRDLGVRRVRREAGRVRLDGARQVASLELGQPQAGVALGELRGEGDALLRVLFELSLGKKG